MLRCAGTHTHRHICLLTVMITIIVMTAKVVCGRWFSFAAKQINKHHPKARFVLWFPNYKSMLDLKKSTILHYQKLFSAFNVY